MRRQCPKCEGNGTFKSVINHTVPCYVCNKKGEVSMLKESVARRMVHGNYADLVTQGWHATAGVDAPTKLMIVIFPDKEFTSENECKKEI